MTTESIHVVPVVKVLIADDHTAYRASLRRLLELEDNVRVVADIGDWQGLERAIERYKPDVVLMDINMPTRHGRRDGIEATRHLLSLHPHMPVLVISMFDQGEYCLAAHLAGARGYYLKDADSKELVRALPLVAKGGLIPCSYGSCSTARSIHGNLGFDVVDSGLQQVHG